MVVRILVGVGEGEADEDDEDAGYLTASAGRALTGEPSAGWQLLLPAWNSELLSK